MSAPRSDVQRAIAAVRGSSLLIELIQKTLGEHIQDLVTIRTTLDQVLDVLRKGGA